jgi:hypothetical protein
MGIVETRLKGVRFLTLVSLLLFSMPFNANTLLPSVALPGDEALRYLAHLGGAARELGLLEDGYASLAVGLDLVIVDLIDPAHPIQVGQYRFSDPILDLYSYAGYAYLLVRKQVHIVDLTNPYRPVYKGTLPGYVYDLDGEENLLFLAEGFVSIYSLSNPASPELVGVYTPDTVIYGEYEAPYRSVHVVSTLPYLYVYALEPEWDGAIFHNEISISLDISDPANPVEIPVSMGYVDAIAATQDHVFFGTGDINVVERENLASLEVLATIETPGRVQGMAVHGNYLYISDNVVGLRILDISNPLAAVEVGLEGFLVGAGDVIVPSRLAYIAGGSYGLVVLNVSDPSAPVRVGAYRTLGVANSVTAVQDYAYVSSDRLDVVDISNPAQLRVVGEYPYAGTSTVVDDTLYLASGVDGLIALDISNPASPAALDLLDTDGEASAVAIDGSYAYLADGSGGLRVVDVSDPTKLTEVGSHSSSYVLDVAVSDGYAYLVGDNFYVADVSDPTSPTIVFPDTTGGASTYTWEYHVEIYGEYVYILYDGDYCGLGYHTVINDAGMIVYQKESPSSWKVVTNRSLECPAGDLKIVGDEVYVTDSTGLTIFDAANPLNTEPIYTFPGSAWSLSVLDEFVLFAQQGKGLHLLGWYTKIEAFLPLISR